MVEGAFEDIKLTKDPEETPILRELYEEEFYLKQNETKTQDSISSLASLCDKVVTEQMTCPTCNMLVKDRKKHTIITGCCVYPFPFTGKKPKRLGLSIRKEV